MEERIARVPDYKGDGAAVWVNQDKNGNPYLSIKLLGSIQVNCFKNIPKPETKPQEIQI